MSEEKSSVFEKAYVNCCKIFVFSVVIAALFMTVFLFHFVFYNYSLFTPSNPIFKAAYEGRIEVIRDYISEGGGINALDKWNNTALHWAAKGKQYNVVKFLINNGVDVQAKNFEGDTALHWATYSNNETIIEYLIMEHADINAQNNMGETPLHMSIILNAFKSAQYLLHLGADPNIVATNGNAALHYLIPGCAEDENCRNLMEEFKNAGCDFSLKNNQNISIIDVIMGKKANGTSPLDNDKELLSIC